VSWLKLIVLACWLRDATSAASTSFGAGRAPGTTQVDDSVLAAASGDLRGAFCQALEMIDTSSHARRFIEYRRRSITRTTARR